MCGPRSEPNELYVPGIVPMFYDLADNPLVQYRQETPRGICVSAVTAEAGSISGAAVKLRTLS